MRNDGSNPNWPTGSQGGTASKWSRATNEPSLVSRALDCIEQNLSDCDLSVEQIARRLDVNASYLSHVFMAETGLRMRRFIRVRRIERAKLLLTTTEQQIKSIAHQTGHANANWFSYLFRKHTGVTPSAFRNGGSGNG